jgi:dihydroorotate dehydrogenase electron transfer subunit
MLRILEHRSETPRVKTIMFDCPQDAVPGQFVMVWVPGVDEFPMSLSYLAPRCGITYEVIGDGTKALSRMAPGQMVGIRGPYGRGFRVSGKRILAVAGGTGIACIAPMVERAVWTGSKVDLVLGARTASELFFEDRCRSSGAAVQICTDDGSKGREGLATQLASEVMAGDQFDSVHACGPEKMITALMPICKERGIPVMEASLERVMKCGIGICDSCAIDGRRVCDDGPVFGIDVLETLDELGRYKRDTCGRKVPLE